MKSAKGCLGYATITVVAVVVICAFLLSEMTGVKRKAAVAHIHKLAETYHVAPNPAEPPPATHDKVTTAKSADNVDARDLFVRIMEMERALREHNRAAFEACMSAGMHGRPKTGEEFTSIEAYLILADELLRDTRRLAGMAGPYFDLDCSKGLAMDRSPLFTIHRLVFLLKLDARLALKRNSTVAPFQDLVALMRLSNEIPRGPLAIRDGDARKMAAVFDVAVDVVTATSVSSEQLHLLESLLPRDREHEEFTQTLVGQASMTTTFFDEAREKGLAEGRLWDRVGASLYLGPLGGALSNQDETYYAEAMVRLAKLSTLPFYEARPQLEAFDREHASVPRWQIISFQELRRPSGVLADQADYEVQLDVLRMGFFLQEYRQQQGQYPESVSAITGNMGGRLPVDPYSGKDYIYVRSADSFHLYSVGYNGIDDGGVGGEPRFYEDGSKTGSADDFGWNGKA